MAASRLRRRRERDATGRFLAEGPQAVREALAVPGRVRELFATPVAAARHPDLIAAATTAAVPVSVITEAAAAALSGTTTPQGLVAVCDRIDLPLAEVLPAGATASGPVGTAAEAPGRPGLVAVLVDVRDPGNAGTVLRTADAAGAGAVVFAGASVDPYNGKCVRASAGSLFHLRLVRGADPYQTVRAVRGAGLRVFAATGRGETDLDDLTPDELARPTGWLFGSEAHGLPEQLAAAADRRVRVPLYGRAESLNLGAAAAVCLYASARASRRTRSIGVAR